MSAQATTNANVVHRPRPLSANGLDHRVETKTFQRSSCCRDHPWIGICDPQNPAAERAFGIVDSCDKTLHPFLACTLRPLDQSLDGFNRGSRTGADGVDLLSIWPRGLEQEAVGSDTELAQVAVGSRQGFVIDHGQSKPVLVAMRASRPLVVVGTQVAVASDDTAEVPTPICLRLPADR